MLPIELLTREDLDEIGQSALSSDDPLRVAVELVRAVDRGRIADRADVGYALLHAAEIIERTGDLPGAEAVAARAVAEYRTLGDPAHALPGAYRAELLLRLGRDDAAIEELSALRPLLTRDPIAVTHVVEALEAGGLVPLAVQWLTAALQTVLTQAEAGGAGWSDGRGPGEPDPDDGDGQAVLAYTLAQQRRRLRSALGQPVDGYDALADQLRDGVYQALADEEDDEACDGTAVLYWPRAELERLLARWPVLGSVYGRDWDEHLTRLERALTRYQGAGNTGLSLVAASADELAAFTARYGGDPTDADLRQGYVEQVGERSRGITWPPGRNDPCWCGSQRRYKKCCLPRARF